MKITYKLLLVLIIIILSNSIYAQEGSVKGIITDESFPLPGATVLIKYTTKGTTTDFDGNFTLTSVNIGDVELEISYMGYETITIKAVITENKTTVLPKISLLPSSSLLDAVMLKGGTQRNSQARALSIQRKSMSIMNVIAADGIGKLPDRNAAETVQRIQGLSIERDQGEGRFVSIRGLPPFWSSTTINGNRIPTAEEETTSRATAFDFFPSDLIAYVQAAKAITPDMEADGIGGNVNFITQTAPAKKTFNVNIGSGYNDKSGKTIYNTSLTFGSKSKDRKLGYIINASHWNRSWGTDNFEARRKGDEGVYRMELRDYNGVRKTTGLNGALEYNLSDNNKLYIKTVYGTLTDEEKHYKHRIRFDKFDQGTETTRVELQNIHNELVTELFGLDLGGKHTLKSGKLDWSLSSYSNSFKYGNIPDFTDRSYFVVKFKQDGVGINPSYLDVRPTVGDHRAYWKADGGKLDYNDTDALFGFYSDPNFKMDATKMKFADLELYKINITERDNIVAGVNYEYNLNDNLKLKFGGKFRDKDRRAKYEDLFYEWSGIGPTPYLSDYSEYITTQPNASDYLNEMGTNIGNTFSSVLSTNGMQAFWQKNKGSLSLSSDSEGIAFKSGLGRNFNVDETHASLYGMSTYKLSNNLTILGGLRATNTVTKVSGYSLENNSLNPVTYKKKYLAILPMLHIKYSPKKDMNIRFAVIRSFARPNFGDISPGGTYISGDNEYKGGNPNLKPTYSLNFDLLGEYYFKNVGVINAGVFYKSITDPIFQDNYTATYNGISGVEYSSPNNGDDAWIGGIELGVDKRFDFLPGVFKYFGTQLNATFMDSEMTKPSGRKVTTPYQAKQLYNAQLYFEKGGFNARVAFNHKGKYAIAFGDKDINDIYYGKYNTLDISASHKIGKHFTVFTDLNNVLNQPLIYHYGKSEDRPKQVEYYGLKGNLGIKFNL